MGKNKGDKPKPKAEGYTPKAGPKSGGTKGKAKKAQAKKAEAINPKEERRIWAEVKAKQAEAKVKKAFNVVWGMLLLEAIEMAFGNSAVEQISYGRSAEGEKLRSHEVKRAVFNTIRKAMVEEGYFGWDKDDPEYVKFQWAFNALWRDMNDLWYNANKAYGHYHS